MIKLNVTAANIAVEEKETLTEGRVGLLCRFSFTGEWDGLAKTAVFDGADSRDVILRSDTVAVPAECLAAEGYSLSVGVYGKNAAGDIVIPTVYATVGKIQRSAYPAGKEAAPPTPDVVAQIQQAAANAEAMARAVREDAELGKFNGEPGEHGGWYTPAVTQPDANTMRVAFTPSKKDMPAVEPADITIPSGGSGSVAVDSTLTVSGQAADAKAVGEKINSLSEEIANLSGGGSGLSSNAKNLLISILRNALYDSDQSDNITALESALSSNSGGSEENPGTVTYTITNNLTNVTSSNNETQVAENTAYTATLTAADGYVMDAVTVSMGGVDVTEAVYANGYITISNVTGDVVITASAALSTETTEELTNIVGVTGWPEIDDAGAWTYTETNPGFYAMFLPGELYGGTIKLEWDTEECAGFSFSIRTMNAEGKAAHTSTGNAESDGTINWVVAGNSAVTANTDVSPTIINLPEGEKAYVITRRNKTGTLVTSNAEYGAWVASGGLKCTITK